MQTLKFLGRGSAFNTKEGNTSAYFIKNNNFFLLDCGETVFETLMDEDKFKNLIELNNIKNVYVYITHLHSDHVGSLSSFIYYCYYVLGIVVKLHHPQSVVGGEYRYFLLNQLLTIQGHIPNEHYIFEKDAYPGIYSVQCFHDDNLKSYSYEINSCVIGRDIFYSGDCRELTITMADKINSGYYDEIYLECSLKSNAVHMSLDYLHQIITEESFIRNRVYLMHIDNPDIFEEAKRLGFKVVELDI